MCYLSFMVERIQFRGMTTGRSPMALMDYGHLLFTKTSVKLNTGLWQYLFKSLSAKFFSKNINMYSQSFLHIDITQVVEILPFVRQRPT